jgi:hypothetical protein
VFCHASQQTDAPAHIDAIVFERDLARFSDGLEIDD